MKSQANKRNSIDKTISKACQRHSLASTSSKMAIFRKNKSQEIIGFLNIKKEDIFDLIYRFLGHLITDSSYLQDIIKDLGYTKVQEHQSQLLSGQWHPQNESENKQNSGMNISAHFETGKQEESQTLNSPKIPENNSKKKPRISIMGNFNLQNSFSDIGSASSSWFSETKVEISNLQLPQIVFDKELLSRIFEEPEPFLINLALCLMAKLLSFTQTVLNCENVCWILSISTIVAYKIYYDEPVGGLISSFAQLLETSQKDIKELQRYFFQAIEFQATITNQQYHKMLTYILSA